MAKKKPESSITIPDIPSRSLYEQGLPLTDVVTALRGDLSDGPCYMRLVSPSPGQDRVLWVDARTMEIIDTSAVEMPRRPVSSAPEYGFPLAVDLRRFRRMSEHGADDECDQASIGVSVSVDGAVTDRENPLPVSRDRYAAAYTLAARTGPHLQAYDYQAERRVIERLRDRGAHLIVRGADRVVGFWRLIRPLPARDARLLSARLSRTLGGEAVEWAPQPRFTQDQRGALATIGTREPRAPLYLLPKGPEHVGALVPRFEVSCIGVTGEVVEPEALAKMVGMDLSKPAPPAPAPPRPAVEPRKYLSMAETWRRIYS